VVFSPQHGERRKTSKSLKDKSFSQTWWYIPIIPELRSLRQEDQEFKANQRPYLKKKNINRNCLQFTFEPNNSKSMNRARG
jgi:hypothetical protein